METKNKLIDFDRLNCESEFTKAVPQKIMASDLNPNGVHLYIEQRAYIAKELEEQGYRKADEVRKETAQPIFERLINEILPNLCNNPMAIELAKYWAKEYGVEVN